MAILQATPEMRLGVTVLNKALFYADLCALRDIGETITGMGYVAAPAGPILQGYERHLVRALERTGNAEQENRGYGKPMLVRLPMRAFDHITEEQRAIAELVARKIHHRTATWVSDYSHENPAWQAAYQQGSGTPINLYLALTQIVEDDGWLDEADDESFSEALAAAENDAGIPF